MLCGKWETFPREFAKCRRCRKAKYCGKECQSKAWSEGHRFWCSVREGDDNDHHKNQTSAAGDGSGPSSARSGGGSSANAGSSHGTTERRLERERNRQRGTEATTTPAAANMNAMLFSIAQGRSGTTGSHSATGAGARGTGVGSRSEVTRTDTIRPNRNSPHAVAGQPPIDSRHDSLGADASDAAYSIASGSSSASSSTANSGAASMDILYSTGHRRRTDTVMQSSMASYSNPDLMQPFIPSVSGPSVRGGDYVTPYIAEGQNDEDSIIMDSADISDIVSMRDNGNDDMILG